MPKVAFAETSNITEHVRLIHQQASKSIRDPELRQLAVKIVSGNYPTKSNGRSGRAEPYIRAWGKDFVPPPGEMCLPRDAECEARKVWDFVVLNVRYVYDNAHVDTFATAKETLLAGGGDCDDMTIVFIALLNTLGFQMQSRVISVPPNPNEWVHIYPLVGFDKDRPTVWMPLDATVTDVRPGWEYPDIARKRDFLFRG